MSLNMQGWNFDNSYTKLPTNLFTRMSPLAVSNPHTVVVNHPLSKELGLHLEMLSEVSLAQLFSGNLLPEGAELISQAYAGHQFGHFTNLGDGRAHLVGEQITPSGRRVDIQFKGSGKTPYSRGGDGKATLEPMLREYIISEAMHALHIPTTRSLAVVTTGEPVYRETILQGAILTRIASSHIRVGTFEYLAAQNDKSGLIELADYVIARHFAPKKESKQPYLSLLEAVIEKQADLIAAWMRVGFIHGVMNTDNMAISGETIDYGPCAFMDMYSPQTVFSAIDTMGRYSFINQSIIAQWNLARFSETLLPLLHPKIETAIQIAEKAVNQFALLYQNKWLAMMRYKLGLFEEQSDDKKLFTDLLHWMAQQGVDYTNTFRELSYKEKPNGKIYDCKDFQNWHERWQLRLKQNNKPLQSAIHLMQANNPAVIPRNHKVNQCLNAASKGDLKPFNDLLCILREPYKDSSAHKEYLTPPTPQERIYQTFCGT